MSPRKFYIICIAAVIAVVALTMLAAGLNLGQAVADTSAAPSQGPGTVMPDGVMIQPLSLGLSLTVVIDMGLMTFGLVILFKDEAPGRYRAR